MCYCCVSKGRVLLCKQSTPSVIGNPLLYLSRVLKGFPVNYGTAVKRAAFIRLSLCTCGLVDPHGRALLSLPMLDRSATVTWWCVSCELQIYTDAVVLLKCTFSEWFHVLFEDETPSWTENQMLLQTYSVYQDTEWREYYCIGSPVVLLNVCPGHTQDFSHSAQPGNNPQSWSDTHSLASSPAMTHVENLFFARTWTSITEVFTLCSTDSVKMVLYWLEKEQLKLVEL